VSRVRVKICGITSAHDALAAVSAGADYVGVIFADSPRRVDLARAQEIRVAIPDATLVGVFRDQPLDEVVHLTVASGVNLVQLHGSESPAYCDGVRSRTGRPVIKAFHSRTIPGTRELAAYQTTSYFLFDVAPRTAGGPARSADTDDDRARVWADVSKTRRKGFRVFLAGALDPSNVRDAVRQSHAFAVDVCRGVERSPGVKDPDSISRFIAEVRS
jgi:phosphoribosylanthranilate isomerase